MLDFFNKPVDLLEIEDLEILKENEIAEGLYFEYKSEFPENLAKIVASLANTFGGWIIIGADARNPSNIPLSFPGIPTIDNPKDRFRHICRDSISPVPLFSSKLINLPDTGKGVLIARIEESAYPPHITRDGRIYRRNSEGSDPVPENDRYTLDRLFEKSRQNKNQVKAIINQKLAKSESHSVNFKVIVCPVPLNLNLIYPFFVDQRIDQVTRLAVNIWGEQLPSYIRFEPEGFTFVNHIVSLEVLMSGIILYTTSVPTIPLYIGNEKIELLDSATIKAAVQNTLEFARNLYHLFNYMGLFIPKVALENSNARGLDDCQFIHLYKGANKPVSRYTDIVLPYGYSPINVKELYNQKNVSNHLLQLVYRSFGFRVLDGHRFD